MTDQDSRISSENTPIDGDAPSDSATKKSVDINKPLPNTGFPDQKTVISNGKSDSASWTQMSPKDLRELGEALEGQQLEHFQLEEFVGGGGMGAVFRAMDMKLSRPVAVKVLSRNQSDVDTLTRFKNEALSAARLDHPNIAHVYYVGEDDGWHFIVFEFIDGVNIRDLVIQKGPLSVDEALSYTQHITDALSHANKRDVVHRDIKPSNVLVTEDGQAKLVDMGLARLHQVEASSADLTASGVTLGTFDYISPEQARDPRNTDVRSDLYSLGCTLYFMLVGQPPFPGGTVLQKLLRHSSEIPQDVRVMRPTVDDSVIEVLDKLLAKSPSDRYQTPEELHEVISEIGESLQLPSIDKTSAQTKKRRADVEVGLFERNASWVVPIVGLVILLVVLNGSGTPDDLDPAAPELADSFVVKPIAAKGDAPPEPDAPPAKDDSGSSGSTPTPPDDDTPGGSDTTPMPPTEVGTEDSNVEPGSDSVESPALTTVLEPPTDPTIAVVLAEQDPSSPVDNSNFVGTFEEAIRLVNQEGSQIREIEIWQTGIVKIEPAELFLADRTLTIRSGPKGRVTLSVAKPEFLPSRPKAFHVHGGELRIENIDVDWDITETRESWSLFYLDNGNHLTLSDSLLSVKNENEPVALIDLAPSPMLNKMVRNLSDMTESGDGELSSGQSSDSTTPPRRPFEIRLQNVVARGKRTTFLRAEQSTPATLEWQNGLLLTTDRFAEIHGLSSAPTTQDASMSLRLEQVTLRADAGIGRLVTDSMRAHLLPTTFELVRCMLLTKDQALFQQIGVAARQNVPPTLKGSDNFFFVDDDSDLLMILDPQDSSDEPIRYSLAEVQQNVSSEISAWYPSENDESAFQRVQGNLEWPILKSDKLDSAAVELQEPLDYELKIAPNTTPAAGMDRSLLPQLEAWAGELESVE